MASQKKRAVVILQPGQGRTYNMGPIKSTFKADGAETGDSYSVSEWWLEPNTQGPPAHSHEEDHVYYILAGTMSIMTAERSVSLSQGAVILIPGGMIHTFENRDTKVRAGLLSFNNRAGFEKQMPSIVEWFKENPAKRVV